MLSKCAHPTCFAQFRYFRQGKVYKVLMPVLGKRSSRIEYFWLCSNCAQMFKIVFENGAVTTHPLYLQLTDGLPGQPSVIEIRKVA
jgi:hypothetical protein